MAMLPNTINYLQREATELGMECTFERLENSNSYIVDVKADDASLTVIVGARGAIKWVNYIDPLNCVSSYKGKKADYFKIRNFFGAVKRQREMLAKRDEEARAEGGNTIDSDQELKPNCGVVAVANALNEGVDVMMNSFKDVFKFGNKWQGRTNVSQLSKMLRLWDKPNNVKRTSGYTLERWVDMETVKGRAYIVRTGNHFQYVKDGIVSDQYMTMPVGEFHLKRKRVTHVIEIKGAK